MSLYMPDPELRRARFDALFREHHPAVQAYARRRVPPEVVDDIVSETFLVVWRRLDDVPERPLPWLLAVTRNVVGTEWRGAARRNRLWLKAQSGHIRGYNAGEPESADGRVLSALAALKERDREALTLVAWDGLTPAQAAATLGEPPARFRQRLHRAGRRLRAELAAELAAELRREEAAAPRHDHAPTGGRA
jgi:RNA polymerase sigma-70 factor (ECF subfamily)